MTRSILLYFPTDAAQQFLQKLSPFIFLEIVTLLGNLLIWFFLPVSEWTRVTPQWIEQTFKDGVILKYTEENDGLTISGQVTSNGCLSGKNPGALTLMKSYWTKRKYTQEFYGKAVCWSIFGDSR